MKLSMRFKSWKLKSRSVRESERARIQVMSNFLKINLLSLELQLKSLISIQKSIRLILRETFLKGLSLNSSKTFRFLSSNHWLIKSKCCLNKRGIFFTKWMKKRKKNIKRFMMNTEMNKWRKKRKRQKKLWWIELEKKKKIRLRTF